VDDQNKHKGELRPARRVPGAGDVVAGAPYAARQDRAHQIRSSIKNPERLYINRKERKENRRSCFLMLI
jgi:hypothetical protein